MIDMKPLEELGPEHVETLAKEDEFPIYKMSKDFYECIGVVPYGIVGMYYPSLLSQVGVLWFVPYAHFTPTFSEIKYAKKNINLDDLFEANHYYADAKVDDAVAINFLRFMGMTKVQTLSGYHIFERRK